MECYDTEVGFILEERESGGEKGQGREGKGDGGGRKMTGQGKGKRMGVATSYFNHSNAEA